MTKKTIGILGGMGPLATADLFHKIISLTAADCDGEHVRVYIDSNSAIPDRTAAILGRDQTPFPPCGTPCGSWSPAARTA